MKISKATEAKAQKDALKVAEISAQLTEIGRRWNRLSVGRHLTTSIECARRELDYVAVRLQHITATEGEEA